MEDTKTVNVGIVGGGLMGKELAGAIARWPQLTRHPVRPRLVAVCDTNPDVSDWFERFETVRLVTTDYEELLAGDEVDVLYISVPHHLHERIYLDAIKAGKDFLGEKPFGIDCQAAERICDALAAAPGCFARCSSEMPFFPGALLAYEAARSGELGRIIEARSVLLHSSDLDPAKPINWKRQQRFCGAAGVMADLGMHTLHLPMRLRWLPSHVYAVLQDLVATRPGPDGRPVPCDTVENATVLAQVPHCDAEFLLTIETKRIAPGHMNTWGFSVIATQGAVEFSTRHPKTLRRLVYREGRQAWEELETGTRSAFQTTSGAIFEFGFADAILQMLAAFLAEREGALGDALGCVTPSEALGAHHLFAAALRSAETRRAEELPSLLAQGRQR